MRKQPAIEHNSSTSVTNPARTVTVLSVSPHEADHLSLQAIIGHSKWKLFTASDLASAISLLQAMRFLFFFVNGICGQVRGSMCWNISGSCRMLRH